MARWFANTTPPKIFTPGAGGGLGNEYKPPAPITPGFMGTGLNNEGVFLPSDADLPAFNYRSMDTDMSADERLSAANLEPELDLRREEIVSLDSGGSSTILCTTSGNVYLRGIGYLGTSFYVNKDDDGWGWIRLDFDRKVVKVYASKFLTSYGWPFIQPENDYRPPAPAYLFPAGGEQEKSAFLNRVITDYPEGHWSYVHENLKKQDSYLLITEDGALYGFGLSYHGMLGDLRNANLVSPGYGGTSPDVFRFPSLIKRPIFIDDDVKDAKILGLSTVILKNTGRLYLVGLDSFYINGNGKASGNRFGYKLKPGFRVPPRGIAATEDGDTAVILSLWDFGATTLSSYDFLNPDADGFVRCWPIIAQTPAQISDRVWECFDGYCGDVISLGAFQVTNLRTNPCIYPHAAFAYILALEKDSGKVYSWLGENQYPFREPESGGPDGKVAPYVTFLRRYSSGNVYSHAPSFAYIGGTGDVFPLPTAERHEDALGVGWSGLACGHPRKNVDENEHCCAVLSKNDGTVGLVKLDNGVRYRQVYYYNSLNQQFTDIADAFHYYPAGTRFVLAHDGISINADKLSCQSAQGMSPNVLWLGGMSSYPALDSKFQKAQLVFWVYLVPDPEAGNFYSASYAFHVLDKEGRLYCYGSNHSGVLGAGKSLENQGRLENGGWYELPLLRAFDGFHPLGGVKFTQVKDGTFISLIYTKSL